MNEIVRVALRRPYAFIVMGMLIVIFGVLALLNTPTDIFPEIRIPVIGVAWNYVGLPANEMSGRIVTPYERILTTTVNDIEHVESQSLSGIGIVKIYLQPGTDLRLATAQVTSISQTALRSMPTGTVPPLILNYNAATVPILQIAQSSPTLSEQSVFDLTQVVMRPILTTTPGAAIPYPYGGRIRQIQIDLDSKAMQSKGVTPQDVQDAVSNQNLILPVGSAKIGSYQYNIQLNDSVASINDLNHLPIKTSGGSTLFVGDVGYAHDGAAPQTNIVHVDGHRAVLSTVLKNGSVSILSIVQGIKDRLPKLKEQLPPSFHINLLNDQSLFVKSAVEGVVKEGVIAACLTSLMVLLFLGSWRSTLIIAISIPLSVLAAITALSALGETLNVMTLGGLALAVGLLVDDATVTIENVNTHLEMGKNVHDAILDGADQILIPTFVALLCICVVFVPMFALGGVAGFLFAPMAKAVMLSMTASFILSRTLVPTMAMYLLKPHDAERLALDADLHHGGGHAPAPAKGPLEAFQRKFEEGFASFREGYHRLLEAAVRKRAVFVPLFLICVLGSFALTPFLGSNFFPSVDSGQMTLHVRGPVGTRVEDSAVLFNQIEQTIRQAIPADEVSTIVDSIGIPNSSINMVYNNSGVVGPSDGDIFISLGEKHHPTEGYAKKLREILVRKYPGATFAFLPADIVSQILNFGAPAPIDVQISGPDNGAIRAYAGDLLRRFRHVDGLVDARLQQADQSPQLGIAVDRSRLAQIGLSEKDVTYNLMTSLAGTGQVAPSFWLNPKNGVSYPIVAQTPDYNVNSMQALENTPVGNAAASGGSQILGGVAKITREVSPAVVSHYNAAPVIDVYAAVQGRDLGGVSQDIQTILKATRGSVPKGGTVVLRGQVATMNTAFSGLLFGIIAALVLVYLLIVVNFQSWTDAFVIITALPAAMSGIVWMLFATGTPLSVPALTGAIMCLGVATANAILVISYARERLDLNGDPIAAAVEAGFARFRPVIMTALAMIIGMAPMALGLGDGGEQNAPLGRAVIGGLSFATIATLIFVPVVFAMAHHKAYSKKAGAPEGASHV